MAVGRRWLFSWKEIVLPIAVGLITLALQATTGGGVTWLAVVVAVGSVLLAAGVVPVLAYVIASFAAPNVMILDALARIEDAIDATSRGNQSSRTEDEPDRDDEARAEIHRRALSAFRPIQLTDGERDAFERAIFNACCQQGWKASEISINPVDPTAVGNLLRFWKPSGAAEIRSRDKQSSKVRTPSALDEPILRAGGLQAVAWK
jgi:hypothetical protein